MKTNVLKNSNLTESDLIKIKDNRHKIKPTALAEKFDCTESYVNMLLRGDREPKSYKAKNILEGALKILEAIND
ncbi:hypothetical protein [Aquimarina algiphila]|uniref:Uncharacterized protein n=1 Tax=Aquimarina algiphila TaxID=2047982 RepID=A0A554VBK5_9FLAO|nr:hypothetical protein [Aquimarina algiphila]TSE03964.1 hypothetical protein FOF46_27875 [Aquimarina algiphila]